MKLAVPNLKTLDYKQLLINHGEKIVIAVVGLMIVTVLYGSNWKSTDKTPSQLTDKADKVRQQIDERPWPEKEEKEKAGLGKGNDLSGKVVQLLSPISASAFGIPAMNPPLHPDKTLISMPRWLPVKNLIAESGVAEFTLKPGTPAIDQGFIRKTPKDKEPKNKTRDRAKRREAKEPKKKEKKEENDESIPEELRPKKGGAGPGNANGMGMGGIVKFGGRRAERQAEKRGMRSPGTDALGDGEASAVRAVAARPVGRGYHFVAVRGIFPFADEISELARVMGVPSTQKELHGYVQFRDFKLERQTRIDNPGADPWSGPWEPVDSDFVKQLLENDVNSYAPETVVLGLVDGHICMPYPERMVGEWDHYATHPDIKEFTLSDEEVEKQVEYEWKLLEKVKKEEEQGQTPVDKGGFMGVQKNMRQLARQAQVTEGDEESVREKILKELKSGNGDKDQLNEQLEEFVRTRATAVDHYVLFRYLDLKVEPGKTYRYRVKLVVTNPFREKRVEEVTDPSIIEGEERETEYSEPTPPVTVKEDAQFFVKRIDSHVGRPSLPSAEMDIFQWFAETGTVVNKALQTQIGQILGGRKSADVLRPAENVFDNEKVLFSTKDALVDVSSGFSLDPSLHKDLLDQLKNVPNAKRTVGATAPDQALVADENGELHVLDGLDQRADYDKTKTHYDLQNKPFESLRKPGDADEDLKGGAFGRRVAKKGKDDPRRHFGRGARDK